MVLIDIDGIAELFSVQRGTAKMWATGRKLLPPHVGRDTARRGQLLWDRAAIIAWGESTGRLVEPTHE
tara:strand:+ start:85 stop:288 length:204 start_codon:yes stop_codon:yes gene_type:complete